MHSSGMAYLLWLGGCIGICGLHRFYLGKPLSGIIWLVTAGLLGFGQIIDIFLIPGMTAKANRGHGGGINISIDNRRGRR